MLRHPWTFRPRLDFVKTYEKSLPDWEKIMNYFEQRQILMNKPAAYSSHFIACISSWHTIGMSLGQLGAMDTTKQHRAICVYARCPDPSSTGTHLICSLCLESRYCSARCQKAWVLLHLQDFARDLIFLLPPVIGFITKDQIPTRRCARARFDLVQRDHVDSRVSMFDHDFIL